MKIGQIFQLPDSVLYKLGDTGSIKDRETAKVIIAKYEVVEIDGELKGRVTNTYGHKRRNFEKITKEVPKTEANQA